MILPYKKFRPRIHATAFVAPGSHVIGDVTLGKGSSVWFGAVLRGDMGAIRVGEGSNIQDNCVLHGDHGKGATLGARVTMGHQATIHAAIVEDECLIGIGARILTGARIGAQTLVGAGALVLENTKIPPRSLVVGAPARVVRPLSQAEVTFFAKQSRRYRAYAAEYRKLLG